MYMKDKPKFESTAKFWTETYARPEASRDEVRAVDGWVDLGRDLCVCGWVDSQQPLAPFPPLIFLSPS